MAAESGSERSSDSQLLKKLANYAIFLETIILKATNPDPFSEGTIKTRLFIQQIDNKIVDASEATNERKIKYIISLFREIVVK